MIFVNVQRFEHSLSNANIPIYRVLEDLYEGDREIADILPILQQKRVNPEIS